MKEDNSTNDTIATDGENFINVLGARVHNLKNIDVSIPRNKFTVITGLSGSGKSSLAFDTIYAEGQRRYMETMSAYARQFLGGLERPDVDQITGLSPVIAIEQKTTNRNPRSTVGTITEVYDFMRLIFARASDAFSYVTGEKMVKYTEEQILNNLKQIMEGRTSVIISHRVSSVKHAGQIIVLDNGQIVERGDHFSLLEKKGIYSELFEKQLLEEEEAG